MCQIDQGLGHSQAASTFIVFLRGPVGHLKCVQYSVSVQTHSPSKKEVRINSSHLSSPSSSGEAVRVRRVLAGALRPRVRSQYAADMDTVVSSLVNSSGYTAYASYTLSSGRGIEPILFLVRTPLLDGLVKIQQDLFLERAINFPLFYFRQLIADSPPVVVQEAWRGSDGESVSRCRHGVGAASGASLLLQFRLSWRCSAQLSILTSHIFWYCYQHP